MPELRLSTRAPAGALFRLLLVRWRKLGWFAGVTLFLVWMGSIVLRGGRSLSDGVGFEVALFWLLAPTLAFVAGHLPERLKDDFSASPFTRSLPGLREGTLQGTLLLLGGVGVGVGGTALALGIGGPEAVAAGAVALVVFLVPSVLGGFGLLLFLLVLVALHLVWIFAPTLPAQAGGGSPGLIALVSLLVFLPLLTSLVRTHRFERLDWSGISGAGTGNEPSFSELLGNTPGRRTGWSRRLSWGAPPTARRWRERPIRAAVQAGHYERAAMNTDSPGLIIEWLFPPVLLIGVGLAFAEFAFALFILGGAVACTHPGIALVGALSYPLSRRNRARVVWAAFTAQGVAGVALAGCITWAATLLFTPADFGLPGGAGPLFLLALILAWLPVGMVVETLWRPDLRRLDRTSGRTHAQMFTIRLFTPALAVFAGVMASLVGIQLAGLTDPGPGDILRGLGLLALVLHGAGWLFLRRHFGRCNLGPAVA